MKALQELLAARTPKHASGTTHRVSTPEETWRAIAPCLVRIGITRVANVTGLDHVGIPVWQAIRPNSRSLSVSQGKGIDHLAAKVSAVMESLEQWCAERPRCDLRLASFAELRDAADPETLPLDARAAYTPATPLLWTRGFDLIGQREMWVPFELVHTNTIAPGATFLRTTNGLASGNSLVEAILHALYEVIERDAHALWKQRADIAVTRVDVGTMTDPAVLRLVELYEAARLVPIVWNMTSDIGVATMRVIAFDADTDPLMNPMPAAYGAGCHLDRVTALVRGLTEAAQSRLGYIAGSRDDLDRARNYDALATKELIDEYAATVNEPTPVAFTDVPTAGADTIEDDLRLVLARLTAVGIRHAVAVPLGHEDLPVSVARVVVPGLEGASSAPGYRPGPRAKAVKP